MLQEQRVYYRPFEYPQAYKFYETQQSVHWVKSEIKLAEDLQNWKNDLTQTEKNVIGGILKGFTQMEVLVGDYWRRVAEWFPKPEIAMMSGTFSYFENIHMDSYSMINEELGLDDFKAFLYDETTKNKIDYFIDTKAPDLESKAKSLAIFSAFAEGTMLFSSFAVLLSFQTLNLMKGVSQIVSFSVRDENLHSMGGCWLFNTLCTENDGLRERVLDDIFDAADTVYKLECEFIDNLFKDGTIRTITSSMLKNYVAHRLNTKLGQLGYNSEYFKVDQEELLKMSWFDMLAAGKEFGDFFAVRVSEYTEVNYSSNDLF